MRKLQYVQASKIFLFIQFTLKPIKLIFSIIDVNYSHLEWSITKSKLNQHEIFISYNFNNPIYNHWN